MDFFTNARTVRLRSHLDKYLYADEDEEKVRQSSQGSTRNVKWEVEYVEGDNHVIRLKSCYGRYLTATASSYLTGMTGKKVIQTVSNKVLDLSSINWEPIRDRYQVKFRSSGGNYLRANGGPLPWKNTITHDVPYWTKTQEWIKWIVDVIDITETGSFAGSPSAATSSIPAAQTVSLNDSSRTSSPVTRPPDAGTPVVPPASAPSSNAEDIELAMTINASIQSSNAENIELAMAISASIQSSNAEDIELAMAISASIQSAVKERPPLLPADTHHLTSGGRSSAAKNLVNSVDNHNHNGWGPSAVSPVPPSKATTSGSSSNQAPNNPPAAVVSVPSAPPIPEGTDDGPVHYPSIDKSAGKGAVKDDVDTSSCVICLDAPVEGACIPCGHMAGCMSCLKEIKAKKWGCPVCRAKIDQVIRLYTV